MACWGRLGRDRARFYTAEIVEGVEGLHKNGVIYRDLNPETVLIGSDEHIVLTGFGHRSRRSLDAQCYPSLADAKEQEALETETEELRFWVPVGRVASALRDHRRPQYKPTYHSHR